MNKRGRIVGVFALLFGLNRLMATLDRPGVRALHGFEIVELIASGGCFAVARFGLFGRLKMPNE